MELTKYLHQMPFASVATAEEMKIAAHHAHLISFGKGEVVHTRSQTECLGMVMVLSGSLAASMISDDGKQILLYRLEAGEVCSFTARCVLNLLSYEAVVEGETEGTALVIPVSALEILMKNVLVENAMMHLALKRCSQIMCALERVLFNRVDKRLAQCLLLEAEKKGKWEVHLTHEQLAREISSAREVVSRNLSLFCQKGLISMSRGIILILDPNGLKEYK